MQQIEQSIDRYLAAMDSADRATPEVAEAKAERMKEKIETLKKQMQKLGILLSGFRFQAPDTRRKT